MISTAWSATGIHVLGLASFRVTTLAVLVGAGALTCCAAMLVFAGRRRARSESRWETVDKRLSEVLWRTRHSDGEELRKRTAAVEEQLTDILHYLRTVAGTIDSQIELLAGDMKVSLSKIHRADSREIGQTRMIIYQLERVREQLKAMDEAGTNGSSTARSVGKGRHPGVRSRDNFSDVSMAASPLRRHLHAAEQRAMEVENLLEGIK